MCEPPVADRGSTRVERPVRPDELLSALSYEQLVAQLLWLRDEIDAYQEMTPEDEREIRQSSSAGGRPLPEDFRSIFTVDAGMHAQVLTPARRPRQAGHGQRVSPDFSAAVRQLSGGSARPERELNRRIGRARRAGPGGLGTRGDR